MRALPLLWGPALCLLATGCSQYHVFKGNAALERGDLAVAEREYLQAPGSDTAQLNLAVVRIRQGRLADAARLLAPLTTPSGPMDPPAVYVDLHTLSLSNSRDVARRDLSLVDSDLSADRIRHGRFDDAFDLAQKALTADPTNLYAKVNLAICVGRQGYVAWAAQLYHDVLRAPQSATLKSGDGRSLRQIAEASLDRISPKRR